MGFKAAGGHPVPLCQVARGQMHVNRADTRTGTFVCCSSFGQRHKQNIRNNWSDKKVGFDVLSLALRARSAFSYCSCKNGVYL